MVQNDSDFVNFTQFELNNNSNDLEIITTPGESPRDIRFYVDSTDSNGQNVSINLSSSKTLNDSGEIVLISDVLANLDVTLNGHNGEDSLNAGRVCAQKILNDELGAEVKNIFLQNRIDNPALPNDECTEDDLSKIQSDTFGCDPTFSELASPSLNSTRWVKKRTCSANAQRKMCVKRTMTVKCTWLGQDIGKGCCSNAQKPPGGGIGGVDWQCNPSLCGDGNSGWYLDNFPTYSVDESYVRDRRSTGMSDGEICDELTGRDINYLNSGFTELRKSTSISKLSHSSFYRDSDGMSAIKVGRGSGSYGSPVSVSDPYVFGVQAPGQSIYVGYEKHRGCFERYYSNGNRINDLWDIIHMGCPSNNSATIPAWTECTYVHPYTGNCMTYNTVYVHKPGHWVGEHVWSSTSGSFGAPGHYDGGANWIKCWEAGGYAACEGAVTEGPNNGTYDYYMRDASMNSHEVAIKVLSPNGKIVRIIIVRAVGTWF